MTEQITQDPDDAVTVAVLEVRIEDLQKELRQSRRGYVSKAKIRQAADYGKAKFGFCREVDNVLEKFGLSGPDQIKLKVDLGQFGTTTLQVDAEAFEAAGDEEQKMQYLSEKITLNVTVSGGTAEGGVHPPVLGFEEVEDVEPAEPQGAPAGYNWRYTSSEGRVQHLVEGYEDQTARNGIRAVCGAESSNFYGQGTWTETSARAETNADHSPRRCNNCTSWRARNSSL